ncbi:MAG TPA: hypothetical protein VGP82_15990, partial [Ktedonobacterales bacterium]|nr:hypothetical protein [Ktedonobacterales bacterium]
GADIVFPILRIVMTALLTAITTTAVTLLVTRRGTMRGVERPSGHMSQRLGDLIGVGVASGLGVLLWRLGANVAILNDDPIPGVSPADVLSAPLAFVAAEVYGRVRRAFSEQLGKASGQLAVAPAIAAVVALVVNIVAI